MLSSPVGYALPQLCSFPCWGFDSNGVALAFALSIAPYSFLLSWSFARSRALASCLRLWEASLRLRAHGGVGAGDDDCRFLKQVVEERVGKQKPQIPKNEKQNDKTKKKANKMPL
jgi:hypothetical protein